MNLNASPAYKKQTTHFNKPGIIYQRRQRCYRSKGQHLEELAEHPRLEKLHEKSNAVMMEDLVEEKNQIILQWILMTMTLLLEPLRILLVMVIICWLHHQKIQGMQDRP